MSAMNSNPRLLDLFCGAGGCSVGYTRAGFDVVGVDSEPQPHYPYEFIQADAMAFPLDGFDVIHASPPCPLYSLITGLHPEARSNHPDLVAPIRTRLQASGKPYVIENVIGSPVQGVTLCGAMFGLRVYRHRLFESNVLLFQPTHLKHRVKSAGKGKSPKPDEFWCVTGHIGNKTDAAAAMGIDWMDTANRKQIVNAIPPAYTDYLGAQLLYALRATESGGAA